MSTLRQAAQQALEALESGDWYIDQLEMIVYSADDTGTHEERAKVQAAITALRQALAEPEQEPVAHLWQHEETGRTRIIAHDEVWTASNRWHCIGPLYLGSAPTPRKPLTDEEIDWVTDQQWAQNNHKPIYAAHRAYARAIERAHGIGGGE